MNPDQLTFWSEEPLASLFPLPVSGEEMNDDHDDHEARDRAEQAAKILIAACLLAFLLYVAAAVAL